MSAKPQCPIMTSFLRYTLLLNTLYIWSRFVFSKKIWCFWPKFNRKFTKWVFREMITSENLQLISQRLSGPPFNKNYSMVSLDTMPPDDYIQGFHAPQGKFSKFFMVRVHMEPEKILKFSYDQGFHAPQEKFSVVEVFQWPEKIFLGRVEILTMKNLGTFSWVA